METVYFFTVILLIGIAYFIYKKARASGVKGGSTGSVDAPKRRHADK